MAKIQIKSEKLTPFGGIFSIMEKFDSMLSPVIDSTLGQRCSSIFGYQFSEIVSLGVRTRERSARNKCAQPKFTPSH